MLIQICKAFVYYMKLLYYYKFTACLSVCKCTSVVTSCCSVLSLSPSVLLHVVTVCQFSLYGAQLLTVLSFLRVTLCHPRVMVSKLAFSLCHVGFCHPSYMDFGHVTRSKVSCKSPIALLPNLQVMLLLVDLL